MQDLDKQQLIFPGVLLLTALSDSSARAAGHPLGEGGGGVQKKRLSSSGTPLANVQSQKIKWTKCVCVGLAREQKIRHAGQSPVGLPPKAAAQWRAGVQEHFGGVWDSLIGSYDTGSVAGSCLDLGRK